jgi:hypothetical protein
MAGNLAAKADARQSITGWQRDFHVGRRINGYGMNGSFGQRERLPLSKPDFDIDPRLEQFLEAGQQLIIIGHGVTVAGCCKKSVQLQSVFAGDSSAKGAQFFQKIGNSQIHKFGYAVYSEEFST